MRAKDLEIDHNRYISKYTPIEEGRQLIKFSVDDLSQYISVDYLDNRFI